MIGFAARNSVLPEAVQTFLKNYDFGARTIYPFVLGENNDQDVIFSAISELQPGALMGSSALMLFQDTGETEIEIMEWVESLELDQKSTAPKDSHTNTVATATVTPGKQQVLYLWEEGNAPAVTEYTVNNGSYSDDPDFRPYLTSFSVPEGTEIKGAVLICPGGAFQFRSDKPEGSTWQKPLALLGIRAL